MADSTVDQEERPSKMEQVAEWPVLRFDDGPDDVIRLLHGVDPNQPLLAGRDISKCPTFSTKEVAQVFFQRSTHWMRLLEREKRTTSDRTGRRVAPLMDASGRRHFTLADIEDLAHVLAQNGVISVSKLHITLQLIHLIAIGYGVLPVE